MERNRIHRAVGLITTGLMLVPLMATAQSVPQQQAPQQPQQGQADSDRWGDMHTAGANRAAPTAAQPQQANAPNAAPQIDRVRNVSSSFEENVANNCHYRATVRGTVREVSVPNATADNAVQYAPDLRLNAELQCPDGSARTAVSSTLRGPRYGREQLAQTISERTRVFVGDGQRICNYSPRLMFDNGRLAANGVAQSCTTARGGGPADEQQQNPSIPYMGSAPTGAPSDTGSMGTINTNQAPQATPAPDAQQGQRAVDDTLQHAAPNLGNDSTMQMNENPSRIRNQINDAK